MKAEFRILKNGYDRFQVDRKIFQYEQEIEALKEQVGLYEKQLAISQQRLQETQGKNLDLQNELELRQKVYRDINETAIVQANDIVDTAHRQAHLILAQAVSSAKLLLAHMEAIQPGDFELVTQIQQLINDIEAIEASM